MRSVLREWVHSVTYILHLSITWYHVINDLSKEIPLYHSYEINRFVTLNKFQHQQWYFWPTTVSSQISCATQSLLTYSRKIDSILLIMYMFCKENSFSNWIQLKIILSMKHNTYLFQCGLAEAVFLYVIYLLACNTHKHMAWAIIAGKRL